jgi:hypothetical protein
MSASFAASAGLAVIGTTSLAIAPRKQKILAIVPLLFSLQQAIEGIQWLYLGEGTVCRPAAYGFLVFALLVWPVLIPLIVYLLDKPRRHVLKYFVWLGALVALWFAYLIFTVPLDVRVIGHHIFYDPPGALSWRPDYILYIVAAAGGLLASSKRVFRALGGLALILAAATMIISWEAATSVWCFFDAAMSACVYAILHHHWLSDGGRGARVGK